MSVINADEFERSVQALLKKEHGLEEASPKTDEKMPPIIRKDTPGPVGKTVKLIIKPNSSVKLMKLGSNNFKPIPIKTFSLNDKNKIKSSASAMVKVKYMLQSLSKQDSGGIMKATANGTRVISVGQQTKPNLVDASTQTSQEEEPLPKLIVSRGVQTNISGNITKTTTKTTMQNTQTDTEDLMNQSIQAEVERTTRTQENNVIKREIIHSSAEKILKSDVKLGVGPKMANIQNAYPRNEEANLEAMETFEPVHTEEDDLTLQLKEFDFNRQLEKENMLKAFKLKYFKCLVKLNNGNYPIHEAVLANDFLEVQKQCVVLRLRKSTVDLLNDDNYTPLQLAIRENCDLCIIKFLLNYDAKITPIDENGETVIHTTAAELDDIEKFKILVKKAVEDEAEHILDSENYNGCTPLLLSVIKNDLEKVQILIKHKIDVNKIDKKSGKTSLFIAVENNNVELIKLLLKHGADKSIKNFDGLSAHDLMFEICVDSEIRDLFGQRTMRKTLEPKKRLSKYGREAELNKSKRLKTVSVKVPLHEKVKSYAKPFKKTISD